MLSPPDDLPVDELSSTIAAGWGRAVGPLCYRPLGFGSHHWEAVDGGGARWFVTVDELETKRHSRHESLDSAFERLEAALGATCALRDSGAGFAVAPLPTLGGEPVVRTRDRFAVALYPYVDGQSFDWGEFPTPEHRRAVLDMVVAVHSAPAGVRRLAMADDFAVPHRDELEAALAGDVADCGPYARPTVALLADHGAVRRLLDRHDDLVDQARVSGTRSGTGSDARSGTVLTHGEPHPGNTMLTADGWRLVDWETALVAPPERDLWGLDPGDGSMLDVYAEATGFTPRPAMLELYRLRWDVSDLAIDVARFRRRHTGSADDHESWRILSSLVAHIEEVGG